MSRVCKNHVPRGQDQLLSHGEGVPRSGTVRATIFKCQCVECRGLVSDSAMKELDRDKKENNLSVEGKVSARGFVNAGKPTPGTAATQTRRPELGQRANCENPLLKASIRHDPRRNPG